MKKNNHKYKLKDIYGNDVPDSAVSESMRDLLISSGNYKTDCKHKVYAYCSDDSRVLLSSVDRNQVKFIAGLWRVQKTDNLYKQKVNVRDKQFFLGRKIDHQEKNMFEYYRAAEVFENCYGIMEPTFDYIVAKYDTDNGTMWSYGRSIEQARAFLGIALFDRHIDLIHAAEHKESTQQR